MTTGDLNAPETAVPVAPTPDESMHPEVHVRVVQPEEDKGSPIPLILCACCCLGFIAFGAFIGFTTQGYLLPLWLLLGILPGAIFMFAVYLPRPESVEPNKLLLFFIIGCFSVIAALIGEIVLSKLVDLFLSVLIAINLPIDILVVVYSMLTSFVIAAFVEELVKFSMSLLGTIYFPIWTRRSPWGFMALSMACAVGFATTENVEYVLGSFLSPGVDLTGLRSRRLRLIFDGVLGGTETASVGQMLMLLAARGLMSVPLHTYTGISYGSDGARILFAGPDLGALAILKRFVHIIWLPFLIHGSYDCFLMLSTFFGGAFGIVSLVLAGAVWVLAAYKISKLREFEKSLEQQRTAEMDSFAEEGITPGGDFTPDGIYTHAPVSSEAPAVYPAAPVAYAPGAGAAGQGSNPQDGPMII